MIYVELVEVPDGTPEERQMLLSIYDKDFVLSLDDIKDLIKQMESAFREGIAQGLNLV